MVKGAKLLEMGYAAYDNEYDRKLARCHRLLERAQSKYFVTGPWSSVEVELLKRLYLKVSYELISDHLGRSVLSIKQKVRRLGLATAGPYTTWTKYEIAVLKKFFKGKTIKDVLDTLKLLGIHIKKNAAKKKKTGTSAKKKTAKKKVA